WISRLAWIGSVEHPCVRSFADSESFKRGARGQCHIACAEGGLGALPRVSWSAMWPGRNDPVSLAVPAHAATSGREITHPLHPTSAGASRLQATHPLQLLWRYAARW